MGGGRDLSVTYLARKHSKKCFRLAAQSLRRRSRTELLIFRTIFKVVLAGEHLECCNRFFCFQSQVASAPSTHALPQIQRGRN